MGDVVKYGKAARVAARAAARAQGHLQRLDAMGLAAETAGVACLQASAFAG